MDDDQFERLMDRLNRMSSYIETLVIENREFHHYVKTGREPRTFETDRKW